MADYNLTQLKHMDTTWKFREMTAFRDSQERLIDSDQAGFMEEKTRKGYF
jgi:3'-phosphoadenosine 5'-phosphosulfate sulfotransferase (PAPS reductase)/FAD synthetase